MNDKLYFTPFILELTADCLHRNYRRLRKYPNHVTEICKFRNKTVFRQLLESLILNRHETYVRTLFTLGRHKSGWISRIKLTSPSLTPRKHSFEPFLKSRIKRPNYLFLILSVTHYVKIIVSKLYFELKDERNHVMYRGNPG